MKNCLKWSVWMWRRSATTGFIFEASFVLQDMVRVLSDPERVASSLVAQYCCQQGGLVKNECGKFQVGFSDCPLPVCE